MTVDEHPVGALLGPSDKRWAEFVDSMPGGNVFHHPAWVGLLAKCYGCRPFVIGLCDHDGEIRAGLPLMEVDSPLTGRRWISLPFTDHCSPLYHGDSLPSELFEYLRELQTEHGVPSVELRTALPQIGPVYQDNGQVLHFLRLSTDPQEVFSSFHHSQVRRNISRAEREGVTVRWAQDERDLDAFYDLHVGTRHRLGVPVQPRRYFELLWRRLIRAGLGFILLAYRDGLPIAGGVFLTYKTTLVYKYGASDRSYWQYRPNHLLFWTAIRWGCENEYGLFDWGKSDKDNEGLRRFKDRWGTEESVLTYSVLAASPPTDISDRLAGPVSTLIRHTPPWVCRATGELLYGHFA